MKASKTAIWGLSILATVCLAPSAMAQTMDKKAISKATWNQAPREFQIIDDRPIIKDFREAPSAPQGIQLPPPPQGFGGGGGGGGAGAMGDGGGPPVLPGGGMPMAGNGGPAYRTDAPGMGGLPLGKSGFGPTNIPARGMAPRTMLPSGQTTGVHGSMMTPTAHSAGPGAGAGARGGMAPAAPAVQAASYGGRPYTSAPSSGSSGGGGGASTAVRGVLLNRLKQ
jgi:hypothetical protein